MSATGKNLRVIASKSQAELEAMLFQNGVAVAENLNVLGLPNDGDFIYFNGRKYGRKVDVVDNLSSTDGNKALSARQGKTLDSKISELSNEYYNNGSICINLDPFVWGNFEEVSRWEDQEICEALFGDGSNMGARELYDAVKSGKNFLTNYGYIISLRDAGENSFAIRYIYLLDENVIYSGDILFGFERTAGQITNFTGVSLERYDYVIPKIENSLTVTYTGIALSAAMGKKLNDEKLAKADVVNNLTSTESGKALSAAQGKVLNDRITNLGVLYKVKGTKTFAEVMALTNAAAGDTYNVSDAFTLNGKPYAEGTNIVCITATTSGSHDESHWDALGGTFDLSGYPALGTHLVFSIGSAFTELDGMSYFESIGSVYFSLDDLYKIFTKGAIVTIHEPTRSYTLLVTHNADGSVRMYNDSMVVDMDYVEDFGDNDQLDAAYWSVTETVSNGTGRVLRESDVDNLRVVIE